MLSQKRVASRTTTSLKLNPRGAGRRRSKPKLPPRSTRAKARSLRAGEVGLLAGALDINDKKKPNEKLRDFSPPS